MQQLLVIAYFYPPHKGIGGKRVFRWAQGLPSHNISPTVLTTPWPTDEDLDRAQPYEAAGVNVVRRYMPETLWNLYHGSDGGEYKPGPLAKAFRLVGGTIGFPVDPKIPFVPLALRAARDIATTQKTNVLLSTSSPYSSHLVARALAKEKKIPWIADFRDPWTMNFFFAKRSAFWRYVDLSMEQRIMHDADHVLFAAKATQDAYIQRYPALKDKSTTLYSGFEMDSPESLIAPWPTGRNAKVRIAHFGRFYGVRRMGILLDVLEELVQTGALQKGDLELLVLGDVGAADQARAAALSDILSIAPMMPYENGLAVLRGADVLLLCDYDQERYFVPGKLFDYLRVSKPMLAISANDELHHLVESTGSGKAIRPTDAHALRSLFLAIRDQGANQALAFAPKDRASLSTQHSTQGLAEIVGRLTSRT